MELNKMDTVEVSSDYFYAWMINNDLPVAWVAYYCSLRNIFVEGAFPGTDDLEIGTLLFNGLFKRWDYYVSVNGPATILVGAIPYYSFAACYICELLFLCVDVDATIGINDVSDNPGYSNSLQVQFC